MVGRKTVDGCNVLALTCWCSSGWTQRALAASSDRPERPHS
ncbi:hypothetical protein [Nocardiopsis prasina]|nr:hypothetical protein [Nocardiopsis prasina]